MTNDELLTVRRDSMLEALAVATEHITAAATMLPTQYWLAKPTGPGWYWLLRQSGEMDAVRALLEDGVLLVEEGGSSALTRADQSHFDSALWLPLIPPAAPGSVVPREEGGE